jgi:hypothetical protein
MSTLPATACCVLPLNGVYASLWRSAVPIVLSVPLVAATVVPAFCTVPRFLQPTLAPRPPRPTLPASLPAIHQPFDSTRKACPGSNSARSSCRTPVPHSAPTCPEPPTRLLPATWPAVFPGQRNEASVYRCVPAAAHCSSPSPCRACCLAAPCRPAAQAALPPTVARRRLALAPASCLWPSPRHPSLPAPLYPCISPLPHSLHPSPPAPLYPCISPSLPHPLHPSLPLSTQCTTG